MIWCFLAYTTFAWQTVYNTPLAVHILTLLGPIYFNWLLCSHSTIFSFLICGCPAKGMWSLNSSHLQATRSFAINCIKDTLLHLNWKEQLTINNFNHHFLLLKWLVSCVDNSLWNEGAVGEIVLIYHLIEE